MTDIEKRKSGKFFISELYNIFSNNSLKNSSHNSSNEQITNKL